MRQETIKRIMECREKVTKMIEEIDIEIMMKWQEERRKYEEELNALFKEN